MAIDLKCRKFRNDKIISYSENNRNITIYNPKQSAIGVWIVDGCLSVDGRLCDMAFECFNVNLFCEFKGKNQIHAIRQIVNTVSIMSGELSSERNIGIVVSSRSPKAGTDFQKEIAKSVNMLKKLNLSIRPANRISKISEKSLAAS